MATDDDDDRHIDDDDDDPCFPLCVQGSCIRELQARGDQSLILAQGSDAATRADGNYKGFDFHKDIGYDVADNKGASTDVKTKTGLDLVTVQLWLWMGVNDDDEDDDDDDDGQHIVIILIHITPCKNTSSPSFVANEGGSIFYVLPKLPKLPGNGG